MNNKKMNNIQLKKDLKEIKSKFNPQMSITKTSIGGYSIDVFDYSTNEDIGTYVYNKNVEARDTDFDELINTLNQA